MRRYALLAVSFMAVAACGGDGDDGGPEGIADACNPLGGVSCLLPWPSAAFLAEDATTATGVRLSLDVAGMPINVDGKPVEPAFFNRFDGFPPSAPICD